MVDEYEPDYDRHGMSERVDLKEFREWTRKALMRVDDRLAVFGERVARLEVQQTRAEKPSSWSSDLTVKIIIGAMLVGMALGYAGVDPTRLFQ